MAFGIIEKKALGRVEHRDPRNYSATAIVEQAEATDLPPRDRKWRQWLTWYQGSDPFCTLFSALTELSAAPVNQPSKLLKALIAKLSISSLWAKIQEEDRSHGRFYAAGATVLAAAQVGRALGWWKSFAWTYKLEEARRIVSHVRPVIFGTNWYPSLYDRDGEGIARIKAGERSIGGHAYCVNGYDKRRGLWRHEGTWKDGIRWQTDDDMHRLLENEEGEVMIPWEEELFPKRPALLPGGVPLPERPFEPRELRDWQSQHPPQILPIF
jgi:hypothetical protein